MKDKTYENFHKKAIVQTKIIKDNNFTYYSVIQKLKNIIGNRKHLKILDYGCGVGTISLYLAWKGNNVTGVDISKKAIEICKNNAKVNSISQFTNFKSLTEWNNLKNKKEFDLIICVEVIEHIENDRQVIKTLCGLLKKGGYVLITTPSKDAPLYKAGLLKEFDKKVGHLRRYKTENIVNMLESFGIKILEVEIKESPLRNLLYTFDSFGVLIRFFKGPISNLVMLVDNLLVKILGGSNIYIIGDKV